MKRTEHKKLVRDRIPEIILESGRQPIAHAMSSAETLEALAAKLAEETAEYQADRSLEELADLVEVVRGILHHSGISWEELERVRLEKRRQRGGFENGIWLEAVIED